MADFDLLQTDAQVQSILNDGQSAMGASAQTTLTTEYVMLKDTNGVYHKILKSSFTEAIRDTLAGLLVNNDKGTTIDQIAAIASGDFGSITPANLASVLGVGKWIEVQGTKNTPVRLPNVGSGRVFLFSPTLTSANMLCIGTDSGADKQNNPWYSNNVSFGNDNGSCTVTWTQNWTSVFIYIIGY
jgi:hypothetical protein